MTERGTVLVLHPSDEAYGADRVLLDVVRGLTERGWRFVIVLPDEIAPGWLSERLLELGVRIERLPLAIARRRSASLGGFPRYLHALWRARRAVRGVARHVKPRIIHVSTSAVVVGAALGRPARAHLVWHVHEMIVRPRALAVVLRALPVLSADRVIAISTAVKRHLLPHWLANRRVTVVLNGLADRGSTRPTEAHRHATVAFVGRLNRWKGYELFVDAAALIAASHPAARFVMAGDPPPGEEWRTDDLRRRVAAAGLGECLNLLGRVADGAAVSRDADILVIPSRWPEPFGLVALEAMTAGRVVVASNHGGVAEIVQDGVTGVLVPPGDAAALAAAVIELLADPAKMAAMGTAARDRARSAFSLQAMLDGVEDVYQAVLR